MLYCHLPVYKVSYDLFLEIFKITKSFSREYKYTIGQDLKKIACELILNIYRANSATSKKKILQKARENVEVIRLYLRLLKDLEQIGLERFICVNELIESISKQLARWQSSSQ